MDLPGSWLRASLRPIALRIYWTIMNQCRDHRVQAWNVGLGAQIGRKAIVRKGAEIGSDVVLGDYSYVSGPRSYIEAARIGKFCSIARQTTIGPGNHQLRQVTTHPFPFSPEFGRLVAKSCATPQREPPQIGNDVWIGINAVVLRGVVIGDGAVIAAGSVVTRNVEPYTMVAGVPARAVALRFLPAIAAAVQASQWWNWSDEELAARVADFADPRAFAIRYGGYKEVAERPVAAAAHAELTPEQPCS